MASENDLPLDYDAQKNLDTLDLIGMSLTQSAMSGTPMPTEVLLSVVRLLSFVRIYAQVKDNLPDGVNPDLIDSIVQEKMKQKNLPPVSDVADEIMRDLDQTGWN